MSASQSIPALRHGSKWKAFKPQSQALFGLWPVSNEWVQMAVEPWSQSGSGGPSDIKLEVPLPNGHGLINAARRGMAKFFLWNSYFWDRIPRLVQNSNQYFLPHRILETWIKGSGVPASVLKHNRACAFGMQQFYHIILTRDVISAWQYGTKIQIKLIIPVSADYALTYLC